MMRQAVELCSAALLQKAQHLQGIKQMLGPASACLQSDKRVGQTETSLMYHVH